MPKRSQTVSQRAVNSKPRLSHAQVLAYLAEHLNFFLAKDRKTREVIQHLILPVKKEDNVISLTEYQNQVLKKSVNDMHEQMRQERQTTSYNYQLMQKIHSGCLELLNALDVETLARELERILREALKVKHYSFILLKPAPSSSFYLTYHFKTMLREAREILEQDRPAYGRDMPASVQEALGGDEAPDSSYLCLPLHIKQRPLGCLCFFSADADRFVGDKAIDLMIFFQAVLAIALDRCLKARNKKAGAQESKSNA